MSPWSLSSLPRGLRIALFSVLAGAAVWFLTPPLLPILAAFALAAALERPVCFLTRRLRLPRPAAAALAAALLALGLCGGLLLLLWRGTLEGMSLLERLPLLLTRLTGWSGGLRSAAERLLVGAPVPFQEPLRQGLSSALDALAEWAASLSGQAAALAARWVGALPRLLLFLFTALLATFLISARRPDVLAFLWRQVPPNWRPALLRTRAALGGALGGWLKAQGKLLLLTFLGLALGLLLLQVELALLCAALIALLDLLPVFGTGTVLLPWAVCSLLRGDFFRAGGLLILYLALTALRSLLEPKLVGQHAGVPPLAALAAMYAGFTLFGAAGMILFPLAAVALKALHDAGVIRLWR